MIHIYTYNIIIQYGVHRQLPLSTWGFVDFYAFRENSNIIMKGDNKYQSEGLITPGIITITILLHLIAPFDYLYHYANTYLIKFILLGK